jgi:hypothetical protein
MDFMIVYVILRKIADWSLSHFYTAVHIDGRENVPKDGPLLMYVRSSPLSSLFSWYTTSFQDAPTITTSLWTLLPSVRAFSSVYAPAVDMRVSGDGPPQTAHQLLGQSKLLQKPHPAIHPRLFWRHPCP